MAAKAPNGYQVVSRFPVESQCLEHDHSASKTDHFFQKSTFLLKKLKKEMSTSILIYCKGVLTEKNINGGPI